MDTHGIASLIAANFCDWNMEKVNGMLDDCQHIFMKEYVA